MDEKDLEIQNLRKENRQLTARIKKLETEVMNWEHCHRQDMADNIRLRNQVAFLMGWDPIQTGETDEQNQL